MIDELIGIGSITALSATGIYLVLWVLSLRKAVVDRALKRNITLTFIVTILIMIHLSLLGVAFILDFTIIWLIVLREIVAVGLVGFLVLVMKDSRPILRKTDPLVWDRVLSRFERLDPIVWTVLGLWAVGVAIRVGQLMGLLHIGQDLQAIHTLFLNGMPALLIGVYLVGSLYVARATSSKVARRGFYSAAFLLSIVFASVILVRLFSDFYLRGAWLTMILLTIFVVYFTLRTNKSYIYSTT